VCRVKEQEEQNEEGIKKNKRRRKTDVYFITEETYSSS
jgi:hypothetical protein